MDHDSFQKEFGAGLDAAETYMNRAKRGIPHDRWAVGNVGAALVARGIEGHLILLTHLKEELTTVWADLEAQRKRTEEGMGVFDK